MCAFIKPELLDESNKYLCETCNSKQVAEKVGWNVNGCGGSMFSFFYFLGVANYRLSIHSHYPVEAF